MNIKSAVAVMTIVGLSFTSTAFAAEKEDARLEKARALDLAQRTAPVAPVSAYVPLVKRPTLLPALYATLGVMQAWDVYSTSAALKAGAVEANPTMAPIAGNPGSMIGLKVATTASTIFFAERMWKKNKVGAVVLMVAINGASAAVSMNNMRNAKLAGRAR